MEARAPVTQAPLLFGTAAVTRYVVGAVMEQIMANPNGGECVYTHKQHEEVCKLFGCAVNGTTPAFAREALKFVIERIPVLMAGTVKCEVVDRGGDLLHIKWTSMARVVEHVSGFSTRANLSPAQTSWNRDD